MIARPRRTRIGKRNQVTLPAATLRRLGLQPGDTVEIRDEESGVSIKKADDPISRLMGILWRPDLPVLSDEELEAEIKRASEEGATARYLRSLPDDYREELLRRVPGYEHPSEDRDEPTTRTGSSD